jgi:thioredoxin-like negative regulator of GroEL
MDKHSLTPGEFGIRIVPAQFLFNVGQVIATIMGDTPKESCEDFPKRAC